jgi:NCS2 family nucleobase:cation symporter-2
MARPAGLVYAADETPPPLILLLSALQHVGVIAITLVYPIIIAREAGLSPKQLLDVVSLSMLALGAAALLLSVRSPISGANFLCPACYTAIYLGPSLFALRYGGLALVFGMTMVAGFAEIAIAPLLRRLRPLFPPEIAGLVIAVVGLSLAFLGARYSLGITSQQGIRPTYLAIAGSALVTMIVLNIWTKGYTKLFCALIGMGVGFVASAMLGEFDMSAAIPPEGLELLRVPSFDHVSWRFDAVLIAPFLVAALASTLRLMGDVSTAQRLNDADWGRPNMRSLSGGVAGLGLASVFCGLVGVPGVNSSSQSTGLCSATGITSRAVVYAIGIIYALMAFVPPVAVAFATMPPPVMGASLFFASLFIFTNGVQMMTARMLDSRKTIVIGTSFAMAVMADVYHDLFAGMPAVLQPVFGSSLVVGTVCAVLLNLVLRIGVRQRVSLRLESGRIDREAVEQFFSEQGARWAARRDIVNRATFGAVQVLEVLEDPPGGVEIEASLDEFNLEVRIRYAGTRLALPEHRPTPREIVATEEGERLLAGYLLRRSADRISSHSSGDRSEVHLHYDH